MANKLLYNLVRERLEHAIDQSDEQPKLVEMIRHHGVPSMLRFFIKIDDVPLDLLLR